MPRRRTPRSLLPGTPARSRSPAHHSPLLAPLPHPAPTQAELEQTFRSCGGQLALRASRGLFHRPPNAATLPLLNEAVNRLLAFLRVLPEARRQYLRGAWEIRRLGDRLAELHSLLGVPRGSSHQPLCGAPSPDPLEAYCRQMGFHSHANAEPSEPQTSPPSSPGSTPAEGGPEDWW